MSNISYLKNANPDIVADIARQYGAVGFIGQGLTEVETLEILTRAVQTFNKRANDLESFFTTETTADDSYGRIVYDVEDFNPHFAFVYIRKTIHYKQFHPDIEPRQSKVERGLLLSRKKAQALVDAMNTA